MPAASVFVLGGQRLHGLKALDALGINDEPLHGYGTLFADFDSLGHVDVIDLFTEGLTGCGFRGVLFKHGKLFKKGFGVAQKVPDVKPHDVKHGITGVLREGPEFLKRYFLFVKQNVLREFAA